MIDQLRCCQIEMVGFSSVGKSSLVPTVIDAFSDSGYDCEVAALSWTGTPYSADWEADATGARVDVRLAKHLASDPRRLAAIRALPLRAAAVQPTPVRRKLALARSVVRSVLIAQDLHDSAQEFVLWDEGVLQGIANIAQLHPHDGLFERVVNRIPKSALPAVVVFVEAPPELIVERANARGNRRQWKHLDVPAADKHQRALKRRILGTRARGCRVICVDALGAPHEIGAQVVTHAVSIAGRSNGNDAR